MMKKLDERGVAAFEFTLVAVPLFTLMFVIFDFGRYAITVQSLRALANAEARAIMISDCYRNARIANATNLSACAQDLLSTAQKQAAAPFLFSAGSAPKVVPAGATSPLTITVSKDDFTVMVPISIWSTALNAPSVKTSIPF
jgi:Flp pilus assembly protein TadG